jgi:hypothetical protein
MTLCDSKVTGQPYLQRLLDWSVPKLIYLLTCIKLDFVQISQIYLITAWHKYVMVLADFRYGIGFSKQV